MALFAWTSWSRPAEPRKVMTWPATTRSLPLVSSKRLYASWSYRDSWLQQTLRTILSSCARIWPAGVMTSKRMSSAGAIHVPQGNCNGIIASGTLTKKNTQAVNLSVLDVARYVASSTYWSTVLPNIARRIYTINIFASCYD